MARRKGTTLKRTACGITKPVMRVAKKAKISNSQNLTSMPSELQYMIYEQVFLEAQTTIKNPNPADLEEYENGSDENKPERIKNPTALLLVNRAVSVEAKKAFQDTWIRTVDIWKTSSRRSISRILDNARTTRRTAASDARFRSVFEFRHININAQIEFNEDLTALNNLDNLLHRPSQRYHRIDYDINLGYLDSHCCPHVLGLVFKRKSLAIMALVHYFTRLRRAHSTVKLHYVRGCHCSNMNRQEDVVAAIEQLEKSCKQHGFPLTVIRDLPRRMPRWTVHVDDTGFNIFRAEIGDV